MVLSKQSSKKSIGSQFDEFVYRVIDFLKILRLGWYLKKLQLNAYNQLEHHHL